MNVQLSIQEILKDERTARGLTLAQVAEETGVSVSALSNYENTELDATNFSPFSLSRLAKFYGLSMDYLFGLSDSKKYPNENLQDLHLNDEAIDLLREGKFNHRLLCELLCHPAFALLMADLEIYVDGMVAAQIQNLNALMETMRKTIIETYHPEEDNTLRALEAVQISEEDYCVHKLHEDIGQIARDLKEAHGGDPTSASEAPVVQELKEQIEYMANLEGSQTEAALIYICKTLGVNYSKLSDEDKYCLIRIAGTSNLKNRIPKRGKSSPKKKS